MGMRRSRGGRAIYPTTEHTIAMNHSLRHFQLLWRLLLLVTTSTLTPLASTTGTQTPPASTRPSLHFKFVPAMQIAITRTTITGGHLQDKTVALALNANGHVLQARATFSLALTFAHLNLP